METPFSVLSSGAELTSLVKKGAPTSSDEIGKWPWAGFYVKLGVYVVEWDGKQERKRSSPLHFHAESFDDLGVPNLASRLLFV